MRILENKNNLTVLEDKEKSFLISYTTTIASYDYTTRELKLNVNYWDYSQSTLKHLKHFINNYTCYNYDSKKDFEISIENCSKIEFVENL